MCLRALNQKKTEAFASGSPFRVYKTLEGYQNGTFGSLFRKFTWTIGVEHFSGRRSTQWTSEEIFKGRINEGFHFYAFKSPARPAPSWIRNRYSHDPRELVVGEFLVNPADVVAVGKFGKSHSLVATKATLICVEPIR